MQVSYRIEVNVGPGSSVKIINVPAPGPFRESVRYAQGNLIARATDLVGDRNPRSHEFTVQLRAFDASRSGSFLGLPTLLALCSGLLGKSLKGGLVTVGGLNLGGTLDPIHNAVSVAELGVCPRIRSWRRKPPRNNLLTAIWTLSWSN